MDSPSNQNVMVPEEPMPSILTWLNEDCWRAVLAYLQVQDIVRSERVCRRWREIARSYLQGLRIRLQYRRFRRGETRGSNCRVLTLDDSDPVLFERITSKLGPLVVAGDCINRSSFYSIAKNCPNIETVTISGKIEAQLMRNQVKSFKRLRSIAFKRCRYSGLLQGNEFHADLPDYCIKKYLESETLEELKIYSNTQVTGRCLSSIKNNLKSLYITNCPALDFEAILSSVDRLTELTKLELNGNPIKVLQNVHLLLNKMPKLEHLSLSRYKETELSRDIVRSLSRLGRLRHLCVRKNLNVTDEWLEAVATSCKLLQTVDVGNCREKRGPISHRPTIWVTADGLRTMCRGLPSLSALSIAYNHNVGDDDVVDCISACPNLTTIDIQGCQLSWYLIDKVQRVVCGRPRPLHMRLYTSLPGATGEMVTEGLDRSYAKANANITSQNERLGSLILDFDPREWRLPEDY